MEQNLTIEAFTYIPEIRNLKCTICESYPSNSHTSSSIYCTYTCRLMLNELYDVLVAPNNNNDTIYVVSANDDSIEVKIKTISILNEKIKILGFELLTEEIYQDCLVYSVLTRISPEWIKIGTYLIESKDFLDYKESMDAIHVNIVKQNETILKMELTAVILNITPYFEPKTCIPRCWKDYNDSKIDYINITLSQQIYVLPNLKKGSIISICKNISHNTVREDWLNQHGYLLPNENELSYCKVKHSDVEIIVYPSICLLSKPLHVIEFNPNYRKTIANFLKIFIRNNSTICGKVMELMGTQELNNQIYFTISQRLNKLQAEVKESKYEWAECNECSVVDLNTQNYDTIVSIPFDVDSTNNT